MTPPSPARPAPDFHPFRSGPLSPEDVRRLIEASSPPDDAAGHGCRAVVIEAQQEIESLLGACGGETPCPGTVPLLIALCFDGSNDAAAAAWTTAGRIAIEAGRRELSIVALRPPARRPAGIESLQGAAKIAGLLAVGHPHQPPHAEPSVEGGDGGGESARPGSDDRTILASFLEIASASAMAEDLDGVLERIAAALGGLFPVDGATLAIREDDGIFIREVLDRGGARPREGERLPEDESHLMGRVILRERPLWRNDTTSELRFDALAERVRLRSDMTIPLRARGRVMGAFRVGSRRRHAYDPEDFELLKRCADLTAVAVETQRLLQATRRLSEQDGLTGVSNHRHFVNLLRQEIDRARRTERPLSLLMIDIDDFKRINDAHGHQAGDRVLRHVAQLVGRMLRRSDTVARYGGEEFAVLLPEAALNEAESVAESLRAEIERSPVAVPERTLPIRVRISIGVATLPGDAVGAADLVGAADRGLYEAKRTGKNRVRHAS